MELSEKLFDGISGVVEYKGSYMKRLRLYFENGHELSIIQGEVLYGDEEVFFEIMPSDPSILPDYDSEFPDLVLGGLTLEQVKEYAKKLSQLPKRG